MPAPSASAPPHARSPSRPGLRTPPRPYHSPTHSTPPALDSDALGALALAAAAPIACSASSARSASSPPYSSPSLRLRLRPADSTFSALALRPCAGGADDDDGGVAHPVAYARVATAAAGRTPRARPHVAAERGRARSARRAEAEGREREPHSRVRRGRGGEWGTRGLSGLFWFIDYGPRAAPLD